MKYLVVGLGNFGEEYKNTRHNLGFEVLDTLAKVSNISFEDKRYGFVSHYKFKARIFVLIKPTTYMNLSGKAVNYWLQKEKIPVKNLIIIVDDIALPFGAIRIKTKGGDGGHNGLKNIAQTIGGNNYTRLRFGVGSEFSEGKKVNYVLGDWTLEEKEILDKKIPIVLEAIKSFGTIGVERTMNFFNNK